MSADADQESYETALKMLAVQVAAQLPATREDADFVLRRVQRILDEIVHDEPADRPPIPARN